MRARTDVTRHVQRREIAIRLYRKIKIRDALVFHYTKFTAVRLVAPVFRIDLIGIRGNRRAIRLVPVDISGIAFEMDLIEEDKRRVVSLNHLRGCTYAHDIRGVGHNRTKGHYYRT